MTEQNGIRGWVYVMTNIALPGLVKVGFSRMDPRLRARGLSGTNLPNKFEVVFEALVHDPAAKESRAHELLAQYRTSSNREFFSCSVAVAIEAIRVASEQALLIESAYLEGSVGSAVAEDQPVDSAGRMRCPNCDEIVRPYESVLTDFARSIAVCAWCKHQFPFALRTNESKLSGGKSPRATASESVEYAPRKVRGDYFGTKEVSFVCQYCQAENHVMPARVVKCLKCGRHDHAE